MTRRWVGGVFGNTVGSNTDSTQASGVFSISHQNYMRSEGGWTIPLGSIGNPATSAQQLRDSGVTTNGLYYIDTPDGGAQQTYCLFTTGTAQGGDHGWMLVGRYQANASNTVRDTLSSQRSMVDVTQNGNSKWSADFGTYTTTEVRVIGCSNSNDWISNRTTDWIYIVPSNQNLIRFLTNQTNYTTGNQTAFGIVPAGSKQGQICNGARDGKGRWTNSSYTDHRISDNNAGNYVRPAYFSAPGSNMWYYHGGTDAKWSVSATTSDSGQDDAASQMFGWDDGTGPTWFDDNQGDVAQGGTRVDSGLNTAAFIFIR